VRIARFLRRLVIRGNLHVYAADGSVHQFGDGSGPPVTVHLHDPALVGRLYFNPGLTFGEAYVDGRLTIEEGTLYEALAMLFANIADHMPRAAYSPWFGSLQMTFRRLLQHNSIGRARRNVVHHYDLSGELYDLFLDSDRQYSCAYFRHPDDDLETAQLNKKRHIAAKLLLAPGQNVLDIGCGWGGMALFLAREYGVRVTGLTLSVEQQRYAAARAQEQGLADRVEFHLRDYRTETGHYDRIVSVGMFEHVGLDHYRAFFGRIHDLLHEDGVALVHSIGRRDGPGMTNPWLRKYIFPGGYCPALSEVVPRIESAGLWITDAEILRLHYAETLLHWRTRFMRNRERAKALYDEKFCRMWEVYLVGCELAFRVQYMMVFQIQVSKRVDIVPITRDYIAAEEDGADRVAARKTARIAG
jgi:cyclopropane-fatty-acyl-phospholipid synthase